VIFGEIGLALGADKLAAQARAFGFCPTDPPAETECIEPTIPSLIPFQTGPQNALSRQIQRLFAFDDIELVFAPDSPDAIADRAIDRETGARGLRSIIEETLMDVQFELPSRRDVKKCVVTRETIEKGLAPTLVTQAVPEPTGNRIDEIEEETA